MTSRMACYFGLALIGFVAQGCEGVSTGEEVEMGQAYADQIAAQVPIVADAEINRYLSQFGSSISDPADHRDLHWRFQLVNVAEPNAFAVPGGFVYVTRGLVELVDSMSQLAGILGHEISHVTRRHSVEQAMKAEKAEKVVVIGCVITGECADPMALLGIRLGGEILFAKFSREDEIQADEDAVPNVVAAGIHPRGIPQIFTKFMALREREPTIVESWFATHPTEPERVERANRSIGRIDPAALADLRVDSPEFRTFRARVIALPKPDTLTSPKPHSAPPVTALVRS
jgi:predicted Zn-dependent protease